MATETALTRVNVFPSESSYNQNKSSIANTELSLIKMSGNFLDGTISSVQAPQITEGRSTDTMGYGKMWTWYRVYESGWVEQGGHFEKANDNNDAKQTVVLPIPMKDIYYTILTEKQFNATDQPYRSGSISTENKTTTSFAYHITQEGGTSGSQRYNPIDWYVCGYKA